ncbi:GNAT family N-acetyltransferase [Virgibacillus indicus]|uniref:GNAT family N-acetyltransferase n=1 Tax=Virgibacillus indicus TaxID=2024554 RepID=A0A265N6R4_9BACI|nr:GNAT family N-acetyltransferase [Virgibacillus indicus]OZU87139.1 GNAT family N-acetyltransferase [Virgibacillus indicus]
MEVKLLNSADAAAYWELRLEALKENPESFATSYEDVLKRKQPVEQVAENFKMDGNFTFGAFDNKQLIGVVTLLQEKPQKLNHRANIFAMYVTPLKRESGIGKALLTAAIKKAQTMEEIEKINLTVVTSNKEAKRLYSKLGFNVFGMEEKAIKLNNCYYDEEHMVLFMN